MRLGTKVELPRFDGQHENYDLFSYLFLAMMAAQGSRRTSSSSTTGKQRRLLSSLQPTMARTTSSCSDCWYLPYSLPPQQHTL